jgi:trigger factor
MEDLKSLKSAVSDQITKQHDQASREKSKRQILDLLADSVSFDLPETLEKEEYNNICKAMNPNAKPDEVSKHNEGNQEVEPDKGMKKEEKQDASEIAKRRVRLGLLLSEIGRKNNIKVEEEDTRNAMMKEIQKYPGQEKQVMDYFKNNPEAQQQLSGPIFEDKIIDFILELANTKEKIVSIEELYKEEELDLNKEADKAKKSNKLVGKNKSKKPIKKVSKKKS